jgi:hypothetical protein
VFWGIQELLWDALFHDPAAIHYRDFIGNVGGHCQIMRDKEVCQCERRLQL